jgi:hypothetical protein
MEWKEYEGVIQAFDDRVGLIQDYWEVHLIGLESDDASGVFFASRLQVLQSYCKKNPAYHIVSLKNHNYFNRPIVGMKGYFLADGDKDPELELLCPPNIVDQIAAFVAHLYRVY